MNYSLEKKESVALTIGSFDGCHVGHQDLIHEMLNLAHAHNQIPTVLTFYPHPRDFFQNLSSQNCLFTIDMKKRFLTELGARQVIVHNFDKEFSQQSAQWFYKDLLRQQLQTETLIIGPNFHFGHKREGSVSWLKAQEHGPKLHILSPRTDGEGSRMISSSRIRDYLREGQPETASTLLGRDYLLEGVLTPGDKIGRSIGVPTLNLGQTQQLVPQHGVYLGHVWLGGHAGDSAPIQQTQHHPALINIGTRPTVSGLEERVEAHLIGGQWPENMYEKKAGFYFHRYVRNEKKFASIDELKTALHKDIAHAKSFFQSKP